MKGGAGATVVKVGGALLDSPGVLDSLWASIVEIRRRRPVVVVHGGGPQATDLARRLGHEPRLVAGRRVTTDLDLEIVQSAIRGRLNTLVVAAARRHGVEAVGLSGADGDLLSVRRRPLRRVGDEAVDFGWVGDVRHVRPALLSRLLEAGYVPVVAPLGVDEAGQTFNVNADTVAQALAGALGAAELLLVTEAGGVRAGDGALLPSCDPGRRAAGVAEGWISGGMRVKLEVGFAALRQGVATVAVVAPAALTEPGRGTRLRL